MPPAEVEQLTFDLLADLAPADARPESVTRRLDQFVGIMIEFCHDWRSLWYAVRRRAGRPEPFEQPRWRPARESAAPAATPCASRAPAHSAQAVLQARVLAMLFGGAGGSRREAAEFDVSAVAPARATRRCTGR